MSCRCLTETRLVPPRPARNHDDRNFRAASSGSALANKLLAAGPATCVEEPHQRPGEAGTGPRIALWRPRPSLPAFTPGTMSKSERGCRSLRLRRLGFSGRQRRAESPGRRICMSFQVFVPTKPLQDIDVVWQRAESLREVKTIKAKARSNSISPFAASGGGFIFDDALFAVARS